MTFLLLAASPAIVYFVTKYRADVRSKAFEDKTSDEPELPVGPFSTLTDFPIPGEKTATASAPTGGMTLAATIQLQGRPTGNNNGEIFIGIAASEGTPPTYLQTGSSQAQADGSVRGFSLTNLFPGRTYIAYIKGPQHLAQSFRFVASQGETKVGENPILLLAGDLNADNVVDAFDSKIIQDAFGATPTSAKWNMFADINNDKIVNNLDLSFVANNFGKTGAGGAWYSPTPTATPAAR
ncbi:MAG: dockerin type I domain-containing protein [bacterium]|nr:dockerin type I domain-containing protein [bacterium]